MEKAWRGVAWRYREGEEESKLSIFQIKYISLSTESMRTLIFKTEVRFLFLKAKGFFCLFCFVVCLLCHLQDCDFF